MVYPTFAAMFFTAISFWQKLLQWDQSLFIKMNSQWTNGVFDAIMPYMRNSFTWIPLYLFLLVLVLLNFRIKGWWWVIFFLVTVGLTDMTGTQIFKYGFHRIRPCNNPDLASQLRLLVLCPSGWSFTSNHAANHFGMATFLYITLRHLFKNRMWLAFLWAGIIGYAQIYVGVHYPFDVAGGAVLGIVFGLFTGLLFNKYFGLTIQEKNSG